MIDFTDRDWDRTKAEELVSACNAIGLQSRLWWDRGPYCAQVALVHERPGDLSESTPSLLFCLEDSDSYFIMGHGDNADQRIGLRWRGMIHMPDDDGDYHDVSLEILERGWLGDDQHSTAEKIAKLVELFDVRGIAAGV